MLQRARPRSLDELAGRYADGIARDLARAEAVLLAVSGGSDSMALLELVAAAWRRLGLPSDRLAVATVDHHLRPRSADDARFVADHCRKLGLHHATLDWHREGAAGTLRTGMQAAARRARYDLLGRHARARWPGMVQAIVTAHTLDDQAETFAMRLQRGAGLDGLAAMRPVRFLDPLHETRLVRPLLAVSRSDLRGLLARRGTPWRDDPSNDDRTYERVRLRHALAEPGRGARPEVLAATFRRLDAARNALDAACRRLAADTQLSTNRGAFALWRTAPFAAAAPALRTRFLMQLIEAFGASADPPRLARVEALVEQLARDQRFVGATLGGCLVRRHPSGKALMVCREPSRTALPSLTMAPFGQRRGSMGEHDASKAPMEVGLPADEIWDRRFLFSQEAGTPEPLMIAPARRWIEAETVAERSAFAAANAELLAGLGPMERWAERFARGGLPVACGADGPVPLLSPRFPDRCVRFRRIGWADGDL